MSVFKLVRVGILAGIAFVLMLIEFPLPFFPDFLKYDTSEIPVLLGTFSMGPWVGVLIQLIKNMLYLFLSGRGNPIGVMGNFLAGSIMVLPAGYVYRRYNTKSGAILALAVGSTAMGIGMIPLNLYILFPLYGIELEPTQVVPMMLGLVLPFNLIKGVMSSTATFLLYKKVRHFLRGEISTIRVGLQEERES
jgi:riboflavin transporter FmnP